MADYGWYAVPELPDHGRRLLRDRSPERGLHCPSRPHRRSSHPGIVLVLAPAKLRLLWHTPVATEDTYLQRYQAGLFLAHYYNHQPVATGELGYISYFHQGPITDFFGLGDHEVLTALLRGNGNAGYWADLLHPPRRPYRRGLSTDSVRRDTEKGGPSSDSGASTSRTSRASRTSSSSGHPARRTLHRSCTNSKSGIGAYRTAPTPKSMNSSVSKFAAAVSLLLGGGCPSNVLGLTLATAGRCRTSFLRVQPRRIGRRGSRTASCRGGTGLARCRAYSPGHTRTGRCPRSTATA